MKNRRDSIAVVGVSGVFPGSPDPQTFCENVLNGKNAVDAVPESRWGMPVSRVLSESPCPDRAVSDKAGLISDFNFTPHGFAIDPGLLTGLDPGLQLSLSAARELVLTINASTDLLSRTGIILAAISLPTEHCSALAFDIVMKGRTDGFSPARTIGSGVVSWPAALCARALGIGRGAFTLDAACASSLVSIKLACDRLLSGQADMMIAGGVSRPDSLYTQIGFSQLQALSPTGICAPFDRNADGLVVGEGVGMIALKRMADAVSHQDNILGVITGAGISNDMEGTLVAPASEGQVRAMAQAYRSAGWTMRDVQYIECHGSGTPVGDLVEMKSLETMIEETGPDRNHTPPLAIGSVKSMIGHLLTAAGAAGFIKTVMAMNRKHLPPSLHFTAPPAGSLLERGVAAVQTRTAEWRPRKPGATRKAGVSAFGFGGINAHILVEEFQPDRRIYHLGATAAPVSGDPVPCAIVGMGTVSPAAPDLPAFDRLIAGNDPRLPAAPGKRFRSAETDPSFSPHGFYIHEIATVAGEFHIPPNQITDILPQHLIMLKAARQALRDAGIPVRPASGAPHRSRFGAAVGIEFDYEATDFHLRWQARHCGEAVQDAVSPPLTFNRTLGALGGICGSRIAREFKLGGPCFTVSAGACSGIRALEIGVSSLSRKETDLFICTAGDMAGDVRQTVINQCAFPGGDPSGWKQFSAVPSEGAAALVIKRLDQAVSDNDRIYAVIHGITGASGAELAQENGPERKLAQQYSRTLEQVIHTSGSNMSNIGLYACGGTRDRTNGFIEQQAIRDFLGQTCTEPDSPCREMIQSTCDRIGNTQAASGMFSIVMAALALFRNRLPLNKPRAVVSSVSLDGTCGHVMLGRNPAASATVGRLSSPLSDPDFPRTPAIVIPTGKWPVSKAVADLLVPEETGHPSAGSSSIQNNDSPRFVFSPETAAATAREIARIHEQFLDLTARNLTAMGEQLSALTVPAPDSALPGRGANPVDFDRSKASAPLFDRDQCLEFAVGKAGRVLGKAFDIIDTYPVRVRLPDEPLMLVDRILSIEGEICSMTAGRIVTQHDVHENAWYLDGNRAPVSIAIEAGQADLFLCAFLGIDHAVKGARRYRLLDARVTFHRGLPVPGETIEYHIGIDRFLKQGEVILFFFHYRGTIGRAPFITMRDGCAGFFSPEEVENSGGIILKPEDRKRQVRGDGIPGLAPVKKESFSDRQVAALRRGDLEAAFGRSFADRTLSPSLILPGGRMHLIDRVREFDPNGGRFGLGFISAEADITPDKWFLTCHFIDDMVMPGTLMYECCAHALRIFTQRIGWITSKETAYYDVIPENESDLKCRGPVTPQTEKARYDVEIKKIGYTPEPYVIADAHMFSDDLRIVLYKNMGLRLCGITESELNQFWSK